MQPTDAILHEVPQRLLEQAKRHLASLQAFNAGIARWREMEQRVGAPGRYEYECAPRGAKMEWMNAT
jgi:hypothetical protein